MLQQIFQPGTKPALVVVDVIKAYTDPRSPLFMQSAVAALDPITSVIKFVRREGHPLIFSRLEYRPSNGIDTGLWFERVPVLKELLPGSKWTQYAEEFISPTTPQESPDFHHSHEIIRQCPSVFFKSSVAHELSIQGCDTIFIVGFATSGAVRATALDALQRGLRPFVIRECVADQIAEVHRMNLIDIQSQCAEVVSLQRAAELHAAMKARSVL